MPSLTDIPVEVFLDNLLPPIPVSDLSQLAATSKYLALLCSDDTFWKRKLQTDFNFSGAGTARTNGWKFIYQRLAKPRVFVWGEKSHGRLGLSKFPKSTIPDVPFPTQLEIPGVRIVSLIAGGMSFHALDSKGDVYVWGALDGTTYVLNSDGFSEPGKKASTPLRLQLPAPTRSISCGRLHSSTLDSSNHVWTFLSWGRPFRLSSPLVASSNSTPVQVECGWGFSSLLTKSGEVFVWWPYSGQMNTRITDRNTELDRDVTKKADPTDVGVIPCVVWDLETDPVLLPSLPALPDLTDPETDSDSDTDQMTQIIQIAGLDAQLVALTNKGHVLRFASLDDETSVARGTWEYLPKFSEVKRVQEHPTFLSESGSVKAPEIMKITHISAHFLNFTAYSTGSSSIVLMGDTQTTPESDPKVIPALQDKSVISVVLGDYHNAALTSTGKLLTWGAYSKGALGLGDPAVLEPGTPGAFADANHRSLAISHGRGTPPPVEVPTEVRFDHARKKPKDRFCISAAAAGWHMGALVIDLEPDEDENESEEEEPESSSSGRHALPRPPYRTRLPGETPPIMPYRIGGAGGLPQQEPGEPAIGRGGGIFRVGYAGRGRHMNLPGSGRGEGGSSS